MVITSAGSLQATRAAPQRPPVAARPAPPAPNKSSNGGPQGPRQPRDRDPERERDRDREREARERQRERDRRERERERAEREADQAEDPEAIRPAPPSRKESITQLSAVTNKLKVNDDGTSGVPKTNGAPPPSKLPQLQKKPAVIGTPAPAPPTAKEIAEATPSGPTEVILTTKEKLPNGKQVEERTVIAPAPNDGSPAAAAAALEKPHPAANVRYSTMSEEQIMGKLREIVNKDDPMNSYSLIKKIGQGSVFGLSSTSWSKELNSEPYAVHPVKSSLRRIW